MEVFRSYMAQAIRIGDCKFILSVQASLAETTARSLFPPSIARLLRVIVPYPSSRWRTRAHRAVGPDGRFSRCFPTRSRSWSLCRTVAGRMSRTRPRDRASRKRPRRRNHNSRISHSRSHSSRNSPNSSRNSPNSHARSSSLPSSSLPSSSGPSGRRQSRRRRRHRSRRAPPREKRRRCRSRRARRFPR